MITGICFRWRLSGMNSGMTEKPSLQAACFKCLSLSNVREHQLYVVPLLHAATLQDQT